jgi:hypothetical protein
MNKHYERLRKRVIQINIVRRGQILNFAHLNLVLNVIPCAYIG